MAITDGRVSWFANDDERLGIAMTQTTHFKYSALYVSVLDDFLYGLQDIECAGGPPTGGCADQNDWFLIIPKILPVGLGPFSYLIENGHFN
jgi:hypothetical protein